MNLRKQPIFAAAPAVVALVVAAAALAAPGALDGSFGSGGIATAPVATGSGSDKARAIAILPGGGVILAGEARMSGSGDDFAFAKLTAAGAPDGTFGAAGVRTAPIGPGSNRDSVAALAIQADGKIVAAGQADRGATRDDFALVRLLPGGAGDPGFGAGGVVATAVASGDHTDVARAVAIQPDGKIVAAGQAYTGSATATDFALARYNPEGSLDPTFGSGGVVTTAVSGGAGSDAAWAVTIQPDGKIVAAGYAGGAGGTDFALARYAPDGSLDTTFGSGGIRTFAVAPGANADVARALALQPDGKIVLAGYADTGAVGGRDFALIRVDTAGALDAAFAGGGVVTTQVAPFSNADEASAVALAPDGRIVAAGDARSGSATGTDTAVARYNPDGSLDPTFGVGGKAIFATAPGSRGDEALAVAVYPDGAVVTGGWASNGGKTGVDFTAAKLSNSFVADLAVSSTVSRRIVDSHAAARYTVGVRNEGPDPAAGVTLAGVLPAIGASGAQVTPSQGACAVAGRDVTCRLGDVAPATEARVMIRVTGAGVAGVAVNVARVTASTPDPNPANNATARGVRFNPRPRSRIARIARRVRASRFRAIRGVAFDDRRVARVKVAFTLSRRVRGRLRCHLLRSNGRMTARRPVRGRCPGRLWLGARGARRWAYRVPRGLPRGRWLVYSRAIDNHRFAERVFSKRAGNTRVIYVR